MPKVFNFSPFSLDDQAIAASVATDQNNHSLQAFIKQRQQILQNQQQQAVSLKR